MTERFSFAVDRHLIDSSMVWTQDNIDNSALTDTMNESYATAEGDSPTRYLSVLDATTDISLENLNITLSNPKLEVEDSIPYTEEMPEQPDEGSDQVVVFNVEGSDELYGIQVVQDEEGNLQKYQFQFRKNENGHLEAIPETITLIPMEEEVSEEVQEVVEDVEYTDDPGVHVYVREDNSAEHILPDTHIEEGLGEHFGEEEEETVMYENENVVEEHVDIKPAILQLQNVKQEIQDQDSQPYDSPNVMEEEETFTSNLEPPQIPDFQAIQEPPEPNFEYEPAPEENAPPIDENSISSGMNVEEDVQDSQPPHIPDGQDFEHVEVSPDMNAVQTMQDLDEEEEEDAPEFGNEPTLNDSDENDYHIVEGLHITGDVDGAEAEPRDKQPPSNILKHALKANTESPKAAKKDKLYFYVVQHPEKENVDSLSLEMSNLCRPKVNPRSILKSSHAMFQARNEMEANGVQDERMNKRFARCKEAVQAMLFHNFINKTTIPQAPVRKNRLPRKQKIKPVERMDEEIVVQEMMVSNNGFVEAGMGGVNKENLAVTEYVDLTDSDDDYDPKRSARKKKKHRRKRIEITISDESDVSHDSVIELDESDDEEDAAEDPKTTNNNTPPKRRRGRPPKNRAGESRSPSRESPAKKTRMEPIEHPAKPEIPCPKCDKTFPSQNSLKTHLQHHNLQSSLKRALPEYKYKCDKCATAFINNILLKKHMCSKLFNCAVCKKSFPDLSSLNGHRRTHAKEQMVRSTTAAQVSPKKIKPAAPSHAFKVPRTSNLKCKTCGKLCSSLQNLNVHAKTHREFACATCSKTFPSQLMLEKHVRESCVKSPQGGRRSARLASEGGGTRGRSRGAGTPVKRAPERRMTINLKVKCEECSMCFSGHQALLRHKVLEHKMETPDKAALMKEVRPQSCKGRIPAGNKLLSSFGGMNCQLNFNE